MEVVSPEEVGLSSAGLRRVDEHLLESYVTPGKIAGALTVVARRGRVVHCSPLGLMDRERGRPTRVDTIFRIYSMRARDGTTLWPLMWSDDWSN